jgi:hypothetical protein
VFYAHPSELYYYIKDIPQEEFEDTKGVTRIRISKKNIQHNGQKKEYKRTNNDLNKHTHRTKDRITRTPLKTGNELRCSGRVVSFCSISGTRRRVNLVTNLVISHEWRKDREVLTTSRGHLWHRYSITVNHGRVAAVTLSKWWRQHNQEESLLQ